MYWLKYTFCFYFLLFKKCQIVDYLIKVINDFCFFIYKQNLNYITDWSSRSWIVKDLTPFSNHFLKKNLILVFKFHKTNIATHEAKTQKDSHGIIIVQITIVKLLKMTPSIKLVKLAIKSTRSNQVRQTKFPQIIMQSIWKVIWSS